MENASIIIMEKEEAGLLNKELGSYYIESDINFIDKIYASNENGDLVVSMYIVIPGDFEDWEYNAILDNYNIELYNELVLAIDEDEDNYSPAWVIKLNFIENDTVMEEKLNELLRIHSEESKRVLESLKDLAAEYKE